MLFFIFDSSFLCRDESLLWQLFYFIGVIIEFIINNGFSNAKELWRGDCNAKAKKSIKTEPLVVNLNISSGHTSVKFDVSGSYLPMPKESSSLTGFLQMAMYSGSKPVNYDNFDCQHWLWLVQNVLFDEDTIIKKELVDEKPKSTTVADLINKYDGLRSDICKNYYDQLVISDPSLQLPDYMLSEKSLECAAHYDLKPLFKKIIHSVSLPTLCELLNTPNVYGSPSIIQITGKNCDSLKLIFDVFTGKPTMIEQLLKVKDVNGNTPMHEAVRNAESLKLIFDVLKGEPTMLKELLKVKDVNGDTPMHKVVRYDESLKIIINTFYDKPEILEELLKLKNHDAITLMHKLAKELNSTELDSLKLIFDVFKGKPDLLKELLVMEDKNGKTPMYFAAHNHPSLKLINHEYKDKPVPLSEMYLLKLIIDKLIYNPELLKELLWMKDKDGKTPLDSLYPSQRTEVDKILENNVQNIENNY